MLTIIVRGKHDTGKTTTANLIRSFLEENGYTDVKVADVEPLPHDQKGRFWDRFQRNRAQAIRIKVEIEE